MFGTISILTLLFIYMIWLWGMIFAGFLMVWVIARLLNWFAYIIGGVIEQI